MQFNIRLLVLVAFLAGLASVTLAAKSKSSSKAIAPKVSSVSDCYIDKKYKYLHLKNVHRESPLAHALLDGLCGIEIGAASYAPFGLKTVNVGLDEAMDKKDYDMYKNHQIEVTGDYSRIDIPGNAENMSAIATSSADFVLHSHVWEHLLNPLQALKEWVRVVKNGGLLFIMVPHRNALESDRTRDLTTIQYLQSLLEGASPNLTGVPHRGHHTVFSTHLLFQIQHFFNSRSLVPGSTLELVAYLEMDDKIKLGHTIVWRVVKKNG
jgi:predicted SAM-dependent methyltransferase